MINAQQITFSKVFSNFSLNPENGVIVVSAYNGYIVLSGSSCLNNNNNKECCSLTKLDQYGNVEWFKQYLFHPGASTLVLSDDLIYVAGHTDEPNSQYTLYCMDSLGTVLWDKKYGDPLKDSEFPRLALWGNKWILYGAQDRNINNRPAPILYFVITDIDGNQLNEFYYGDTNESTLARKIVVDTRGKLLASYVYCPDTCFLDLKAGVAAFDTSSDLEWEVDLPYSYDPAGCYHAQTDSGTIAAKWYVDNNTIPNHDLTPPAFFFTDMSGNVFDTVIFQNQSLKDINSIEPIWERGLVGCGYEYPNFINLSTPVLFGWLFRMDGNREVLWERSYIDSSYQGETFGLRHIIPTSDGGYLATGTITNLMTGVWESHNWLLKLDSLGCLEPSCGNINYVTDTEDVVFLKGKDIKIYPNPVSDYMQVEFPKEFDLKDITLRLVFNDGKTIRQTPANSNIQTLTLSDILSGMYYILG
jgi:Secretion system C-terminal sorting domain